MNKEELKQYIDDNIYENQDGEITGEGLNAVLKAIVDDGGTEVEANPSGTPTDTLQKIKIGQTIYTAPQGPKGEPGSTGATGPANTLTIGTVTDGEQASASITGDAPNQQLNLVLPKGEHGDPGQNAVNPFKGYFNSLSDLQTKYPTGETGDFANVYDSTANKTYRYVFDVSLSTSAWTQQLDSSSQPIEVTPSTATFATGQSVVDTSIVNNFTTGGATNVASAKTVKAIAETTMELVRVVEGLNILDPDPTHSMIKKDRRIKQDGTEDNLNSATQNTIYGCTDYIEITDEGLILNHGIDTISTSAFGCIVYNASKQKIGRKSAVSGDGTPLAITPTSSSQGSGTNYVPAMNSGETVEDLVPKYVRFNLYKPATPYEEPNDGYAIYIGTTLPDPEYQPYGSYTEEWRQKPQTFESGEKINKVSIKDVPTQDSEALITSGGVFEALEEVYETIDEAISVKDEYEVVTATRLTGLRPSSENNTFISVASANYLYYLKVNEGDKVKITATNSSAKTVVFCFSSDVPVLNGSLTNYDERSVTAIDEVFTAPYDGYFCFYHNFNYFTDQVFRKTKINGKFTAKITLEGGGIVFSGNAGQYSVPGEPVVCGYTSGGEFVTGVDDFMNNYRTPLYVKANKVLDVEVDESESFRIFCYNSELTYLGASETNSNQVLDGTEYIKIVVSKSTAYDAGRVLVFNACCENGELVEIFNKPAKSTITLFNSFSFEIKEPVTNDEYTDSAGDAYITTNRHWDNGCIKLPPNYSPFGQPVPLIIFWHGTDGFSFNTPMSSYSAQITFLNNQGYAVCDCSGMTDRYYIGAEAVAGHDCRFNPLAISCFCNLYWHVTKNYNVRRDGCFVFGKSNGGLGTAFLGITKPFPIKAIATLAGSLSIVQSMRYSSYTNLTYWFDRLGLDSTIIPQYTGMYGTNWDKPGFANSIEYIINNTDKFNRIDPMMMMTTIDSSDFADAMLNCAYQQIGNSEELNTIVSSHWKIQPTPMKIWHAVNDTAVPIAVSRFYRDLVNKANGICYLREIPAVSTNGHHAVDNADDAPKVQVTTRFGGSTNIAVAYAEMCEWFDRFL